MHRQNIKAIFEYHNESKHHYERYARSPGYMDWDNQPNPFRFYRGQAPIELPLLKSDPGGSHLDLYRRDGHKSQPFSLENIAGFLELSLGLSAWKAVSGSKWSLRMNPSSGNLHPTEGYVWLPAMEAHPGGLFHYNPLQHSLEPRCVTPAAVGKSLEEHFNTRCFLVALTSIFWRESWKYGERAFRYCNHDIGHALACLSFSANLFGWQVTYLNAMSDEEIETILGFGKTLYPDLEEEQAEAMCVVHGRDIEKMPCRLPDATIDFFSRAAFLGEPNRLSRSPVKWELVYRTAEQASKPRTETKHYRYEAGGFRPGKASQFSADQVIRRRRSAVAFDPEGSLADEQFFAILDKTIARGNAAPFDAGIGEPHVSLLIFVHAVNGLTPGLYFFFRTERDRRDLQRRMRSEFLWRPVVPDFPLYLLEEKNYRRDAMLLSCAQDIAGSSVFSLGMIARFKDVIESEPYRYRHLFWEAGMIGQVLYLEAEAAGLRGTGIGCFFDDEVHAVMGLREDHYQSLYHFTVGVPLEDRRLQTLAPYHHLEKI